MNDRSQSGSDGSAPDDFVLLECDSSGRIAWMSTGARATFGAAATLAEIMRYAARRGSASPLRLASPMCFSPVFETGDRVWISADTAGRVEIGAREVSPLLHLQGDFLRHYFHLQAIDDFWPRPALG